MDRPIRRPCRVALGWLQIGELEMRQQVWRGEDIDNAIKAFVDRRRKRRVRVSVFIKAKGIDIDDAPFEEPTESINFSAGGTCFYLLNRIRVGKTLSLSITLPSDPKTYNTTGIITRVESDHESSRYKYGIRFIHKRKRTAAPPKRSF